LLQHISISSGTSKIVQ